MRTYFRHSVSEHKTFECAPIQLVITNDFTIHKILSLSDTDKGLSRLEDVFEAR